MEDLEDNNGVTVQHRTIKKTPARSWRTWLIGRPLPTADAPHETIGRLIGLAVFASDALSSTAYATQESMLVLAAAASFGAFRYAFPISIAIVILLVILIRVVAVLTLLPAIILANFPPRLLELHC
jgi:hypothetical protein